jgi:hypothetical protein
MKYDHQFTCQIRLMHRNKVHNGLHFGHFKGRKTHCKSGKERRMFRKKDAVAGKARNRDLVVKYTKCDVVRTNRIMFPRPRGDPK